MNTTMNTGAASLSDERERAAITACALMIKGICLTRPNAEWTGAIEDRIQFMLKQMQAGAAIAAGGAQEPSVEQDERAAFEAWMKNRFPHSDTTGFASVMWLAWQARAVSSAPPLTSDSDGWQPIETAPRGAKGYCWMNLAWGPEGDLSTGVGMRWGDRFFAAASFYCLGREKKYEFREVEVRPSYWMPLLSAPAQSTNGEQS